MTAFEFFAHVLLVTIPSLLVLMYDRSIEH